MTKMIFAVALAATMLTGCQSIFGQRARLEVRPAGQEQTAAAAAIALEEGRQALIRGEVGTAIVALRKAQMDPATTAPALNALGAAYAMLGRGDLAEHYFNEAIAADPNEPKYAANLARYYRSREAALAKASITPTPIVASTTEESTPDLAALNRDFDRVIRVGSHDLRIERGSSATLQRVSSQEVAIRTAAQNPNPLAKGSDGSRLSAIRQSYPIRIQLGR